MANGDLLHRCHSHDCHSHDVELTSELGADRVQGDAPLHVVP
jgi:hypothetical protein